MQEGGLVDVYQLQYSVLTGQNLNQDQVGGDMWKKNKLGIFICKFHPVMSNSDSSLPFRKIHKPKIASQTLQSMNMHGWLFLNIKGYSGMGV